MSKRMYTGETPEEFFARRRPLEGIWNAFMAGANRAQFPAKESAPEQELADDYERNDHG